MPNIQKSHSCVQTALPQGCPSHPCPPPVPLPTALWPSSLGAVPLGGGATEANRGRRGGWGHQMTADFEDVTVNRTADIYELKYLPWSFGTNCRIQNKPTRTLGTSWLSEGRAGIYGMPLGFGAGQAKRRAAFPPLGASLPAPCHGGAEVGRSVASLWEDGAAWALPQDSVAEGGDSLGRQMEGAARWGFSPDKTRDVFTTNLVSECVCGARTITAALSQLTRTRQPGWWVSQPQWAGCRGRNPSPALSGPVTPQGLAGSGPGTAPRPPEVAPPAQGWVPAPPPQEAPAPAGREPGRGGR